MTPPPDKILTFVDQIFMSDENAEAKAIILALGMLDHLNKERLSATKKAEVASCGFHPTHWLLVARFGGYDKKEDNGYIVAGWPKKKFSYFLFALQSAAICTALFGAPADVKIRMVDSKPNS